MYLQASGSAKSKAMDNNKLLLDAVKSGKEMLVQNLIQHGVSLSYSDQVFDKNYFAHIEFIPCICI